MTQRQNNVLQNVGNKYINAKNILKQRGEKWKKKI